MKKRTVRWLIGFGSAAFAALCTTESMLALRKALQEKKQREAEQAAEEAKPEEAEEAKPEAPEEAKPEEPEEAKPEAPEA